MKRRNALTTALTTTVAVAAAAGGAGWAWWRKRPPAESASSTTSAADQAAAEVFWAQRFERPQGGELVTTPLRGRPLLLNFWATWCPPCVEELPLLDRFQREQQARGWQVLALAIDRAEPVRGFLAKRRFGFQVALGGPQGFDLIRQFGNAAGGLPFSVAFNAQGRLAERKLGPLTAEDLADWARRIV